MTNIATGRINFGPIEHSILGTSLGYDSLFADIDKLLNKPTQTTEKYPPHNIIKLDEYNYVVELAVAGFSKKRNRYYSRRWFFSHKRRKETNRRRINIST